MDNEEMLRHLSDLRHRVDQHDADISVMKHQQTAFVEGFHKRLDTLERERIEIRRSLNKMELQLDEITPAVRNLMGLMQVWSRIKMDQTP
jgi:hypothetical protein